MEKDREAFEKWFEEHCPEWSEPYEIADATWRAALAYVREEREPRLRGALRQAPLRAAYMVHGDFDDASFHADYDAWFVQRNDALALNVSPPEKE